MNETPIKQIWSRKITGTTFSFLLSEYVTTLNESGRINFSSAWEFFIQSQLEEIYSEATTYVEKQIRKYMWQTGDVQSSPHKKPDGDGDDESE